MVDFTVFIAIYGWSGMTKRALGAEKALAILAETAERVSASTAGLTQKQLRSAPTPGEWSATEVLAHLRACDDIRGGAALRILKESRPTFRAVDPRAWVKETTYLEEDFATSLRAFTVRRRRLVAALKGLGPTDWLRRATVTGAGRPLERTVLFYVEWVARHERPHVKQIQRIAATMRAESSR